MFKRGLFGREATLHKFCPVCSARASDDFDDLLHVKKELSELDSEESGIEGDDFDSLMMRFNLWKEGSQLDSEESGKEGGNMDSLRMELDRRGEDVNQQESEESGKEGVNMDSLLGGDMNCTKCDDVEKRFHYLKFAVDSIPCAEVVEVVDPADTNILDLGQDRSILICCELLERGTNLVSTAIDLDLSGEYENALDHYRQALQIFLLACKLDLTLGSKQEFWTEATGYMNWAKELSDYVKKKKEIDNPETIWFDSALDKMRRNIALTSMAGADGIEQEVGELSVDYIGNPSRAFPMKTASNFAFLSHHGKDSKEAIARPTYWFVTEVLQVEAFFDDENMAPGASRACTSLFPCLGSSFA